MATPDDDITVDLLRRIRAGDQAAQEALFEAHRPMMHAFVRARYPKSIQQRCDESDVVQDALLVASRRLVDYLQRAPMPFRLWLLKTAYEQLVETQRRHIRAGRRSVEQETPLPDGSSITLAECLLADDQSPSSAFQRKERYEQLLAAVRCIDPLDQQILLMRHLEDRSHPEIACILDLESATVRQRYGRALKKLHKLLSGNGFAGESQ